MSASWRCLRSVSVSVRPVLTREMTNWSVIACAAAMSSALVHIGDKLGLYQALAQKPEFQQTHLLLKKLHAHQISASSPLSLPPPPANGKL